MLEKLTLECLLCAEADVIARFLRGVYRALRVPALTDNNQVDAPPLSWVTFHPSEFVKRLLTHIPGSDWYVEHKVIRWEAEDVTEEGAWAIDKVTHRPNDRCF